MNVAGFALIDLPVRTALLPLLVAQALAVRRRAVRLPEPTGPRCGACGDGPPLRLLILGDSSAAGVGVADQSQALSGRLSAALSTEFHVRWQLCARTGATTGDALDWLDASNGPMAGARFDVAVVALGVNDVTRAVPLRRWLLRQQGLIARLQNRFGVRQILLSGLPPMGAFPLLPQPLAWALGRQAARFDKGLRRMTAARGGVETLGFDPSFETEFLAEDGFHPAAPAYEKWAGQLAARIISAQRPSPPPAHVRGSPPDDRSPFPPPA